VLVHGYGGSGRYLAPTAKHLAAYYPTYVPDLPRFGRSAHPSRALDAIQLADVLAGWMRALNLSPAGLVGNSFGCQVIVHLATRHPALVAQIVLTSPTLDPRARALGPLLWRFVRDIPREPVRLVPVIMHLFLVSGPDEMRATLGFMRDDDIRAVLPHVRMPTLVVCGEYDPLAPPSWGQEVARLLPEGALLVIPEAAHALPFSQAQTLASIIQTFLRTGPAGTEQHEARLGLPLPMSASDAGT
jgi:pimeloyl-ACP methyl ester carboxylesterase